MLQASSPRDETQYKIFVIISCTEHYSVKRTDSGGIIVHHIRSTMAGQSDTLTWTKAGSDLLLRNSAALGHMLLISPKPFSQL